MSNADAYTTMLAKMPDSWIAGSLTPADARWSRIQARRKIGMGDGVPYSVIEAMIAEREGVLAKMLTPTDESKSSAKVAWYRVRPHA